jgi:glutathione synthase/RimK-type ligase-like ATP-grasp enzyme
MVVGIHKASHNKVDPELEVYRNILRFNNIESIELNSSSPDFWDSLKKIDVFIYKWGHDHNARQIAMSILPVIENFTKVKVFPNLSTCWHYDDKIQESILLKQCGFPAIDFFVFWDKQKALEWLESWNEFPIVHKLKSGAGAHTVKLLRDKNDCKKMINKMFGSGIHQDRFAPWVLFKNLNYDSVKIFRYYAIKLRNFIKGQDVSQYWQKQKNYIYFQRFMPGNTYDTRVTTAGLRAHAFRRFVRPNDFRASGSNKWDIDKDQIDLRMIKIALEISKFFGFQAMAYDFVYDENKEPRIVEMSYLYGGAGYPDFMNGYWDEHLNWHEGRFWPQHFELMDLLQNENLKCPELEAQGSYAKVKL